MKKLKINQNKRKKIFKILFGIPLIIILLLLISVIIGVKNPEEKNSLLCGLSLYLCICFTLSYVISYIIAFIFFQEKETKNPSSNIGNSKPEKIFEDDNIQENINILDTTQKNVFEYNLSKLNAYESLGKGLYFHAHRKKYLKNEKFTHISNQYTIIIIYLILVLIICCYLPIFFVFFAFLLYFLFLTQYKNFKLFSNKNEIHKIEIDKNGLYSFTSKILYHWESISLIGITKSTLFFVIENPKIFLIMPRNPEIIELVKKYSNIKIIIDD